MRNSLKEPEKPESVERNKKEIDREVETSQDQLAEKPDNTAELRDNDELRRDRQLEFEEHRRRQNIAFDNRDRKAQHLKVDCCNWAITRLPLRYWWESRKSLLVRT